MTLDRAITHRKLIATWNIGWSSNNPAARNVGRKTLLREGWEAFVERDVLPLASHVGRVEFHNPFGTLANEPMQFEQRTQARRAGLSMLVEGCAEAWRMLTDRGIETIVYVGSPKLLRADDDEAWMHWALLELRPALESGCSIAFDAACDLSPREVGLIRHLQANGTRVYIEPWPKATDAALFGVPRWCVERFYHSWRVHPDSGFALLGQLTGETVRDLSHMPDGAPPDLEDVQRVLADGHTAAVRELHLRDMIR